jgi:hypothetical protein
MNVYNVSVLALDASLDATELKKLTPRQPVHSLPSDTAVLAKVPHDQHVLQITNTMENIDGEIYRALNTIIINGHETRQDKTRYDKTRQDRTRQDSSISRNSAQE